MPRICRIIRAALLPTSYPDCRTPMPRIVSHCHGEWNLPLACSVFLTSSQHPRAPDDPAVTFDSLLSEEFAQPSTAPPEPLPTGPRPPTPRPTPRHAHEAGRGRGADRWPAALMSIAIGCPAGGAKGAGPVSAVSSALQAVGYRRIQAHISTLRSIPPKRVLSSVRISSIGFVVA